MKISLILTTAAALAVAPIASQASDKEAVNGHYTHACQCKHRQQVALFVSGRGIGDQRPTGGMQSVSQAQTGQGQGLTFFTGYR
jgi:hypothetical protein